MPLNAGQLDRRITIQVRGAGVDTMGNANGAWQDVAEVWAMAMPKAGREFFAAGQLQSELGFCWRVRHRAGLTAAMRIVEGADHYDIEAIVPAPNREWLDLMCVHGVKDGA